MADIVTEINAAFDRVLKIGEEMETAQKEQRLFEQQGRDAYARYVNLKLERQQLNVVIAGKQVVKGVQDAALAADQSKTEAAKVHEEANALLARLKEQEASLAEKGKQLDALAAQHSAGIEAAKLAAAVPAKQE